MILVLWNVKRSGGAGRNVKRCQAPKILSYAKAGAVIPLSDRANPGSVRKESYLSAAEPHVPASRPQSERMKIL